MGSVAKKQVCVIGAGAAGLAAIRHIKASESLTCVALEASDSIGGIWKYDGVTPMYRDLRTNLPKQIMGYLDFPISSGNTSFLSREEVLTFLHSFSDTFGLEENIRFNSVVKSVHPAVQCDEESTTWEVTYEDRLTNAITKMEFDAVIICNGHHDKPSFPVGVLENFKGEITHSRDYKIPEPFNGKRVLIVGSGPSGIDIMLEIEPLAKEVTISLRNPPCSGQIPKRVQQKPCLQNISDFNVSFVDGSSQEFDTIIVCTGYEYDFPFLSEECGISVQDGKFVTPLYRHLVNINNPTMAFIGLNFRICPCTIFDSQARYYVKFLEGIATLPSKMEMLRELEMEKEDRKQRNVPFHRSHELDVLQWPYMTSLAEDAEFLSLQKHFPVTRKIYEGVAKRRNEFPALYRNDEIRVINYQDFHLIPSE